MIRTQKARSLLGRALVRMEGREEPRKGAEGPRAGDRRKGLCRTRETKVSVAPGPLLPTQKCPHRIRTLWPLRNTSRVPAWLKVVLSVCEALCPPTYPHPTEVDPQRPQFPCVAPFSGRIPSAVVGASNTARESRSMAGTEYL